MLKKQILSSTHSCAVYMSCLVNTINRFLVRHNLVFHAIYIKVQTDCLMGYLALIRFLLVKAGLKVTPRREVTFGGVDFRDWLLVTTEVGFL